MSFDFHGISGAELHGVSELGAVKHKRMVFATLSAGIHALSAPQLGYEVGVELSPKQVSCLLAQVHTDHDQLVAAFHDLPGKFDRWVSPDRLDMLEAGLPDPILVPGSYIG